MPDPKKRPVEALEPAVYTIPQIADLLTLAPLTVRRWIARGDLPSVKVGNRRLVPKAAVDGLLARSYDEQAVRQERSRRNGIASGRLSADGEVVDDRA